MTPLDVELSKIIQLVRELHGDKVADGVMQLYGLREAN